MPLIPSLMPNIVRHSWRQSCSTINLYALSVLYYLIHKQICSHIDILSHATLDVLRVELLPSGSESDDGGEAGGGNGHGKGDLEAVHVSVNDDGLLLGGERVTDGGGSGKNEGLLADVRSVLDHV